MDKKRVAYVTGSRADYGIVRHYLDKLNNDSEIDLEILITGALLSHEYGHQVDLIKEDGFRIGAEIELTLDSSCNMGVLHAMAEALDGFGQLFENQKYDLLIVLGDRYEVFSVAIAAAMQRIPILHLHGGEATYGNYDEFIRHAITKMSLYHFTATEEYRQRVIQLGEAPDRVYNLGALGAENCLEIDMHNVPDELIKLSEEEYFVVLFHPETLTGVDPLEQVNELLGSLDEFPDKTVVFLGSNADTNADKIRVATKAYVKKRSNAVYYENLHTDAYHYLVKKSICLIGNSSSGIIEAPSLGTFTINIGDRQKGRTRGNSVIDTVCRKMEIVQAIHSIGLLNAQEIFNPYYKEKACQLYYTKTKEILAMERVDEKTFFDFIL